MILFENRHSRLNPDSQISRSKQIARGRFGHPRMRAETRYFSVQARNMKIINSPSPPFSKGAGETMLGDLNLVVHDC